MPKLSLSIEKTRQVIGDWDRLRADPDYLLNGGKLVFMHLFEQCPDAKPLFGFTMTTNPRSKSLLRSNRFKRHAKFLLKMLDKTVDLLDSSTTSDDENGRGKRLTDVLIELGRKHVAYGVKPELFPYMTQSVIAMLKETIKDPHVDAWNDVFAFLVEQMTNGYQRVQKDVAASTEKNICMATWDKFSKIRHYKRKGGAILFQHLFMTLPETKVLFGFPADMDPSFDDILESSRFGMHAEFLIEMIEKTINMLGEDDETLEENLIQLGQRHVAFGVHAKHFPHMTKALIYMLKVILGGDFTKEDEMSFEHVMAMLIADMVKGQRKVDIGLSANKKEIVTASWKQLAELPDYETRGGIMLFQNLFDFCPDSKSLFGFPEDIDPHAESVVTNRRFIKHAKFLLQMIEKSVGMLGQDDKEFTETLVELGKKHVSYGVKPEYYPFMVKAIIKMMKEAPGNDFTKREEDAWKDILSIFVTEMVKGQRMIDKELIANKKKIVNDKWAQLTKISKYETTGGIMLFQNLFDQCPEAKTLFGIPKDLDHRSDDIMKNRRFTKHAKFLLKMIEKSVGMLGQDDEEFSKTLVDLGKAHVSYGVKPEYFPFMRQSIIDMMKMMLGKEFSSSDEDAFNDILSLFITDMIRGQRMLDKDLSATKKALVTASWDLLTDIPDYETSGGILLFQKLFVLCPDSKELFGFHKSVDPNSEALLKNKRFLKHATFLLRMIEKGVGMLGKDDRELEETLMELGKKHVSFGVKPQMFPFMTDAIIMMMNEMLGEEFTKNDEEAFKDILSMFITDMIKGQRLLDKDLAATKKDTVVASWAQLSDIPDYYSKGGTLLFQNLFGYCPSAQRLFGFPQDADPRSSELLKSRRFTKHAVFLLKMIEKGVGMLGQDDVELEQTLLQLGRQHVAYGVKPEYFPYMSKSIIAMMKEMLGDQFTTRDEEAWLDILSMFVSDMIRGQRMLEKELADARNSNGKDQPSSPHSNKAETRSKTPAAA